MINVKLEVWGEGPYIKAPDFCPYKVYKDKGEGEEYERSYVIDPSVCAICKLCNFTQDSFDVKKELKINKFVEYLTLLNTEVSTSIVNQNSFLKKKDRIPLAILISPIIFDMMLKLVYKDNLKLYEKIHSYFLTREVPICFILGCPVYLSRKLTKSKVMVVGEVEWQ